MIRKRTYRTVDGVRVEGTWLNVFVKNLDYHATELFVFADGVVQCWERTDLDGLAAMLASGKVTLRPADGARGSYHLTTGWRFEDVHSSIDSAAFLAEVADLIEELNDRPTSVERCRIAIDRYLEGRSEEDLAALRQAYTAIPDHNRRYVLGDMDAKDRPLRTLCGIDGDPDEHALEWAHRYFEDNRPWAAAAQPKAPRPVDDPETPPTAIVELRQSWYADPQSAPPVQRLHNGFPYEVTVDGRTYPTLGHAYWALAVTDPSERDLIAASNPRSATPAAAIVAASSSRVPEWHRLRTAAMLRLLRLKVDQHPDLAEVLIATGDARIRYSGLISRFWIDSPDPGGNWMGRLLELLRSELLLARHETRA
ncbi:NADAR family protein [Glycomyces paridis]|uniref:NADAR family protein n=1 Tax=Glycomyces paridis TaxID=2126555 RepID=A0A4S8PFU3_9ACTN|nr:NADAR family protein [Glycomyces paridis]THV28731.1 NADAR family protein [Glycomyces paridis]